MKILRSSLRDISFEKTLRYDVDFSKYQTHLKGYYTFHDIFSFPDWIQIDRSCLEEDFLYCEIGRASCRERV